MPDISRFLGIIIYMNWADHAPLHFYAKYGDYKITVDIQTGIVRGTFSKRALRAVLDWLDQHQSELLIDWELAVARKPLLPIPPLE